MDLPHEYGHDVAKLTNWFITDSSSTEMLGANAITIPDDWAPYGEVVRIELIGECTSTYTNVTKPSVKPLCPSIRVHR